MNKTKVIIRQTFLFIFSLLLFFPTNSSFAKVADCRIVKGLFCPITAYTETTKVIIVIIQYLFSVIALLCLLFMVIAGIKYITSAGSEERITSAKNSMTSAAYGLIVAVMAYAILFIINTILNEE